MPAERVAARAASWLLAALLSGCSLLPEQSPPPAQPELLGTQDDGALTWHYPGQALGVVVSDRKVGTPDDSAAQERIPAPRPGTAATTMIPASPTAPALADAPPPDSAAAVPLALPQAPAFDASWWICLSSWQQPRAAFAARQQAEAAGLAPIIRRHPSGASAGSAPLFRVLIGPFSSRASAQQRRERADIRRLAPDAWLLTPTPAAPRSQARHNAVP